MILFGVLLLVGWIPIVLAIFAVNPPRRATLISFIVAWLALPNIGFDLPSLPNYTKMTATTAGVMLGILIFDARRVFSLRPKWFDIPVLVWCFCPFLSSVTNGLGVYSGLSAVLDELIFWGIPYLIGRVYFSDWGGLRALAMAVVIGGLAYVPPCLIEMRMSPQFDRWVYGLDTFLDIRYGGYRPRVFLGTGLQLGMWMSFASLLALRMWACRSTTALWGYPFSWLVLALTVTTVLCRSTGALLLMMFGVAILWLIGRTKASWPAWFLIAIVPAYASTRTSGLWSGREAVDFSKMFGEDRAESIEFRIKNEDLLIGKAMERPIFGWGRDGGAQPRDSTGKSIVIMDGYWIIALGVVGVVGLSALISMLLLPLVVLIRRQPMATWSDPEVAPAAALAVLLGLYMIDCVSNAMANPIYGLVAGGLAALPASGRGGRRGEAEASLASALELADEGHAVEAELSFRRAIDLASAEDSGPDGIEIRAESLEGLGGSLMATGRPDEAESAYREAVEIREALAAEAPDPDLAGALAAAREALGRALAENGATAEAIEERRIALGLRDMLVGDHPDDPESHGRRVDALNDLAWLLSDDPDPGHDDPSWAVRLAEEAVSAAPARGDCWNTLGVARYRSGDWAGAVEALERSAAFDGGGGTAFDHFFRAMAWRRLGEPDRARDWFDRAVAWADRNRPGHPGLARFRREAVTVLGEPGRTQVESS